jgi:hypothetical protein
LKLETDSLRNGRYAPFSELSVSSFRPAVGVSSFQRVAGVSSFKRLVGSFQLNGLKLSGFKLRPFLAVA